MSKLKLLLDVDEVICFSGFLDLVNQFLGTNYEIDDFTDYYIDESAIPKDQMEAFNMFINNKDQYENPVFLPGALEAIERLSKIYDIYICSDCRNPFDLANSGRLFLNKYNLLYQNIPQDIIPAKNYILTGTKNIFKADAQVDDLIKNLDPEIEGRFLFPSYHNKDVSPVELFEKGIVRAGYDWRTGWEILERQLMEFAKEKQGPVLTKK